ncbi:MAG: SCO family protein [Aliidongia sp.]
MMRRLALLALAALPLLGAADYPAPQTMHQNGAAKWFGDVVLTDQDGKRVRLYQDLMDGNVVVINAFLAGCRASCPAVMGALSHLHAQMAIDGIAANFVSITVDPEHDTQEALNLYAQALGAGPDWHMLTGEPATVRAALHRFGLDTNPDEDPSDHLNIIYMANLRTGLWKKVFSLAPVEDLETILVEVENDVKQ